ncbi:TPA: SEL1-like repeat protein [Pseudomonas aeruginosa]|nr:SEL1-like repeat protein [Raoultella ornithinolytica]HEP8974287.1 SEL1-like repeat protein [Pseudomonas aeruginosa]
MKYRCAILAFGSLMSLSAFAGYEEGLKAYKNKDYAQALQEWRPLAEQGDARSQYSLGILYESGQGVAKDDAIAVQWLTKAAEQGDKDAQFVLGFGYAVGRGVAKDDAKAVEWYTKAAEQGVAGAQFNLGSMYASGQGVAKDEAKAVQWFTKAAEQGHSFAKDRLSRLVGKYRQDFQDIRTAADARNFLSTYGSHDPDGLIPQAREMERSLSQKEADEQARKESARLAEIERQRVEDEKRRKAEMLEQAAAAKEQAAAAKARADEHKRLVAWRSRIRVESKTNCGPVIEVKGNLIKVYAPVANYSSEHWLERDTLFPPEYGCSFYNGNYRAPDSN